MIVDDPSAQPGNTTHVLAVRLAKSILCGSPLQAEVGLQESVV